MYIDASVRNNKYLDTCVNITCDEPKFFEDTVKFNRASIVHYINNRFVISLYSETGCVYSNSYVEGSKFREDVKEILFG